MSDADWIEKAALEVSSEFVTFDDAADAIREAYAEHCRSVDPDKLAERIEDVYINKLCQLPVGTPWEKARKEVEAHLAPILAHNAAMESVLRECVPIIRECTLNSSHCHDQHDSRCKWEREYYANRPGESQDSVARYERAQAVGCNCGLCDEVKRLTEAIEKLDQLTAKGAGQ